MTLVQSLYNGMFGIHRNGSVIHGQFYKGINYRKMIGHFSMISL